MLLVRFTLERLLCLLSRSSHREQLILKGAVLFALWEPTLHRVARDLDLLGFGHPTPERLADIFQEFCRMEVVADEGRLTHSGYQVLTIRFQISVSKSPIAKQPIRPQL